MQTDKFSRRDFLKKFLKTSALAGITISTGKFIQSAKFVFEQDTTSTVPAFNIPGAENLFSVARGKNPCITTREAVNALGGMERFINRGDRVLIKVNCAFSRPSWVGATTSPEVSSEVVKLCYEAGAKEVMVTDNPISDPESCFLKSGIGKAVKEAGARILLPAPSHFRRIEVNSGAIGTWEVFYEPLGWCDKLIGIPTVKTHNLCAASLSMKNWYGFFGGSRSRFHQDIDRVISELAEFIRPSLIILDGSRMLIRNGPTGGSALDVVPGDVICASTDQVAVDSFGVEILGLDKQKVKFIQLAEEKGLGKSNYSNLKGYKEQ